MLGNTINFYLYYYNKNSICLYRLFKNTDSYYMYFYIDSDNSVFVPFQKLYFAKLMYKHDYDGISNTVSLHLYL